MPPLYRLAEVVAYALLNFLPFLALALYPFRHRLRFSGRVTAGLIAALTLIQLVLGLWAAFFSGGKASLISAISTALYATFYFLAVKMPVGKTLFSLLMISNIANLVVVVSKCIEGQLFPTLAVQSYRWSFSLVMLLVETVIGLPLFIYIQQVYTPAVEKEPSGIEWRYLWLIPATFYLVWYYVIYGNATNSSLEVALRPGNAITFFFINTGACLVYYIVSQLILEQTKTIELQEKNHQLAMQHLQYDNLQEKIAEARRAKHDVRHHVALMQEYLRDHDYDALAEYLQRYQQSLPDDTRIQFCENPTVNAVLLYFAQQAKDHGVTYEVHTTIPQTIGVDEPDLSVLFGNLLENALDACLAETGNTRIIVRARVEAQSLCVAVDNTFTGKPPKERDGAYMSTKHRGAGLGIPSIKLITEKYGGVCKWEVTGGMVYASVMLNETT